MKTSLAAIGLMALMVLPGVANGRTNADQIGGDAAERGTRPLSVSFVLTSRSGEPTAIKRFRFRNLEATCEKEVTTVVSGFIRYMRVNSRKRFNHTLRREGGQVRVKGQVRRGGRKVVGRIRAQGDFGEGVNCDSGRVPWVAS